MNLRRRMERDMLQANKVSQRLHRGVLTAIVHVSSVREPSIASLAVEFAAARQVIKTRAARAPDTLRSVFADGLSLALFKLIAQQHAVGNSLHDLQCKELIAAIDARDRTPYQELVIAAAEAAIDAQIETDPYRRRGRAPWEWCALREIEDVLRGWPQSLRTSRSGNSQQYS
jgi:hypothetical protein